MSEDNIDDFLKSILNQDDNFDQSRNHSTLKEMIDDRMDELNISQNQLEKMLSIERKSLVGILDGTAKRVDVVNIIKIGEFLNIPTDKLLEIYVSKLPSETIGEIEQAKKSNFIISNFDLSNLRKGGFLDNKNDFAYLEDRIMKFFHLKKISDFNTYDIFPAFSRTKNKSNDAMRKFWVRSAYTHFEGINNPNDFDRDSLVELIPKIRPYTRNVEEGLITVSRALFAVGVTVLYQPHLPTVQVRGATFLVNKKPCIVLSDLNKNYPTMWFALMHELYHVLYDLDSIERNVYHLTGEPDLLLMNEDQANEFAREYLLSQEKSKYIEPLIDNELLVREFAKQNQVHPSMIYNFYNFDKNARGDKKAWAKYRNYFPDVKKAIGLLNTSPWQRETIQESIDAINNEVYNLI